MAADADDAEGFGRAKLEFGEGLVRIIVQGKPQVDQGSGLQRNRLVQGENIGCLLAWLAPFHRLDLEILRLEPAGAGAVDARQRAQLEAKQEAQVLVEKARVEIQRERDETIGELRQEFADLTVVAAEKVIGKSLDKEAHRQIIDKVLDESANLKKN